VCLLYVGGGGGGDGGGCVDDCGCGGGGGGVCGGGGGGSGDGGGCVDVGCDGDCVGGGVCGGGGGGGGGCGGFCEFVFEMCRFLRFSSLTLDCVIAVWGCFFFGIVPSISGVEMCRFLRFAFLSLDCVIAVSDCFLFGIVTSIGEAVSLPHISHWALLLFVYVHVGQVLTCAILRGCTSSSLSSGSDRVHLVFIAAMCGRLFDWSVGLVFRLHLFLSWFPVSCVTSWLALPSSGEEEKGEDEEDVSDEEYRCGGGNM
jgi:hypothetical protein